MARSLNAAVRTASGGTPDDQGVAIERAPGTTRWGLRFTNPATELDYQAWYLDATQFFSRLGLLASLVAWTAAITGLAIAIPGSFQSGAPYALSATVVVLVVLGTTFVSSLRSFVPGATAFANAFAGLAAIGYARAAFTTEDMPLTAMGLIIVLFFGFVVFRLHPLLAAVAVATYVFAYGVLMTARFRDGEVDGIPYWTAMVLLASAYVVGLFICSLLERQMRFQFHSERIIEQQKQEIDDQRREADDLLLNILPAQVAERLKRSQGAIADRFTDVSVLFADVVSFTPLAARVDPEELVEILNEVFSGFDELVRNHGAEKIKTIGDAYMAVGGLPEPRPDHARIVADLALDMRDTVKSYGADSKPVEFRIGIATGPVVAGVIGTHKFAYDLWGDTVNTAARMESHGTPGQIQVSHTTYEQLVGTHELTERGLIDVKGKGPIRTWYLTGRK